MKKKLFREAIQYFKEAEKIDPENIYINIELGLAYFLDSNNESALKNYKISEPKIINSGKSELLSRLAFHYKEIEDFDSSIHIYKKILEKESLNEKVFIELGHIYKLKGDNDQALVNYKKAYTLIEGNNENFPEDLIFSLKDLGENNLAEKAFRKLLVISPDNYKYLIELGYLKLLAGNEKESVSLLKKALSLTPLEDIYYTRLLAYCFKLSKRYEKSKMLYEKLLLTNPSDFSIFLNLGDIYRLTDDKRAFETYNKAKIILFSNQNPPENNESIKALAYGFRKLGNFHDSIKVIEKIEGNDFTAFLDIAYNYADLKENTNAVNYFVKSFELLENLDPEKKSEYLDTFESVSYNLIKLESFSNALKVLKVIDLLKPNDYKTLFSLGFIYYKLNNYESANKLYDSAQKFLPSELNKYKELAYGYKQIKSYKKAIDILEKAVFLSPEDPEIYTSLGNNYLEINSKEDSLKNYLIAKKFIKRSDTEIRKEIGFNMIRLGAYKEAFSVLKELEKYAPDDYKMQIKLGYLYRLNNESENSLKYYNSVQNKIPDDDILSLKEISYEYMLLGDNEKAIKFLLRLSSLTREDYQVYLYLGHNYRLLEKYMESSIYYTKSINLKRINSEAYYNLGLVLRSMGFISQAVVALEKSAEQDLGLKNTVNETVNNLYTGLGLNIYDNTYFKFLLGISSNEIFLKDDYVDYLSLNSNNLINIKINNPFFKEQPDINTFFQFDYNYLNSNKFDTHKFSSGLKIDSRLFISDYFIPGIFVSPEVKYNFVNSLNNPVHYGTFGINLGINPIKTIHIETLFDINLGEKDLTLGSFLNYQFQLKLIKNIFYNFNIAWLTGIQNYEIFDGRGQQRNIFKYFNSGEVKFDNFVPKFDYSGIIDISKVFGELNDTMITSNQKLKYKAHEQISLTGEFNLVKNFLEIQKNQSYLSSGIGLEYKLPFGTKFPLFITVQARYNYFFDVNRNGNFHYLVNLRSF